MEHPVEGPEMAASIRVEEQPLWHLILVEGIFAAVGAAIICVRHSSAAIVFRLPVPTELALGAALGGPLGVLVGFGLRRSPLRAAVVRGVLPLRSVTGAAWSVVVVGLAAGLGEELLFRAALQPWIGLGWAAVLFGLAHSGTARLHEGIGVRKAAYLLLTVAAGVLLGLLYRSAGLVASMSAHASFDIGILLALAPAIAAAASAGAPGAEPQPRAT